jgi:predicted alpha/beta hydrolase
VHSGAAALYTAASTTGGSQTFADALAAVLATQVTAGKSLYFVGHSFGGAVATLAAVDTIAAGTLTVSGLYTFGSLPAGDDALSQLVSDKLAQKSFHLARSTDPWPLIPWTGYTPMPTQVAVTGTPPDDDYPFHSIRGYSSLIDPSR